MSLIVYLFFNGNAEEAINFYINSLGGEIVSMQRYGDTPMPCDESVKNKVMHAVFTAAGATMMCSDTDGKKQFTFGDNISLSLDYKDPEAMRKAFDALAEGGNVTMPLQDTFWGAIFGMLTDKFGNNWMFNHDKPQA